MLNPPQPAPSRTWAWPLVTLAGLFLLVLMLVTRGGDPAATIGIFTTIFLGIFIEAAPFLLLGTFVSGLLEVYVSRDDILRWIPRNPILAPIVGTFLGFAFPVCECGVVPVTRRLFTKGLPMSAGIAFLLAAPVMNPIVLVSTYIAFGAGPVLIARFATTAFVSITVGLIFAYAARPEDTLRPASFTPVSGAEALPTAPDGRSNFVRALLFGVDELFDMGRYLVIGSLLAALMQVFISEQSLLTLGGGAVQSVIIMQAIAFLISACSTVDAFLALAFTGTFTTGSIVAFLSFGPMVDIKSTLMFAGVFRPRIVFYLVLLPFLLTLLVGVWINLLMR